MTDIIEKGQENTNIPTKPDLHARSSKLVAAIFIVIKSLEGEDSLKTRIKDLSLKILSLCSMMKDKKSVNMLDSVVSVQGMNRELISLLEVAYISGLISEMNGKILKDALDLFAGELLFVRSELEKGADLMSLTNQCFSGESTTNSSHSGNGNIAQLYKGHGNNNGENKSKIAEKAHSGRRDSRRDAILEFVLRNNGVNIKDILPQVRGCSEKTVQRELVNLINEGAIRKEGDRRWSKYFKV